MLLGAPNDDVDSIRQTTINHIHREIERVEEEKDRVDTTSQHSADLMVNYSNADLK